MAEFRTLLYLQDSVVGAAGAVCASRSTGAQGGLPYTG